MKQQQQQPNLFHLLWQYKRETLKTTKYVELVIVADNREVRDLNVKIYGKHRWEMGFHGIASNVLQIEYCSFHK